MAIFSTRKVKHLFNLSALDIHILNVKGKAKRIRRRRIKTRWRNRGYALNEMEQMSDQDFTAMFRMDREAFDELLELVKNKVMVSDRGNVNAKNTSGSVILPRTRLAVTLRWLAGGSVHDICFAFGVARASFYKHNGVLWPTIAAIDNSLSISFPISDVDALSKIEEGFAEYSFGRLRGCVMAIDGWVVKTRAPYSSEVDNITCFCNRKGFFALVVMAGVDSECRFLMFSCKSPGSTNDGIAWEHTTVFSRMHLLLKQFYIIGDEGFVNTNQCLTPHPGKNLPIYDDAFNFHLSRMRQNVERAFGLLVRKWGIFWRALCVAHNRWALVLTVAAKLHNFCIDQRLKKQTQKKTQQPYCTATNMDNDDMQPGDELSAHTTDNGHNRPDNEDVVNPAELGEEQMGRTVYQPERRQKLSATFQKNGWLRPEYANR
jgi:hypothetical protein